MACCNSRKSRYMLLLISLFLLFGFGSILLYSLVLSLHHQTFPDSSWHFMAGILFENEIETAILLSPFAVLAAYLLAKLPLRLDQVLVREREHLREAYEQLEQSKTTHSALIENSLLGIYTVENGVLTYANRHLTRMSGYAYDEIIGKEISLFFPPEAAQTVRSSITERLEGKRTSDIYTVPFLCKDGTELIVKIYGTITHDDGRPIIMGSLLNITEEVRLARHKEQVTQALKNKEKELLQLKDRHEYLLRFSPAVIYAANVTEGYELTFVSENIKERFGYDPDEVLETHSFWIDHVHPEDRSEVQKRLPKLLEEGSHCMEYRVRSREGAYLWVQDNLRFIRGVDDSRMECVGSWTDISRRKEAEEKITTQELLLLHQSRLATMGEMISMIAHQWRQPLNTISAASIRLSLKNKMDRLEPEEISDICQSIQLQTSSMSQTIDDFTLLTKPSASQERFSIRDCIRRVTHLLAPKVEGSLIDLILDAEDDVDIIGISSELKHVFLTIINNATEAHLRKMGERTADRQWIRISTTVEDDRNLCISIRDNAGGIDEANINRIFEPYFTTKSNGQGSGLGLYIAKMIVENRYNGSIEAANTDSGAEFRIHLRIAPAGANEEEAEDRN